MTRPCAGAQYLFRIDDLCPTLHGDRWQRLRAMLHRFHVQPILAIVPENRDPELQVSPPAAHFWPQMREMARQGATIAMHGWQHLCLRQAHSLIPLHPSGEFAGVPLADQEKAIADGLRVLRGHGLAPRLFVAPRHSIDRSTLSALRAQGIEYLSDGFARRPFLRGGIVWIPQQLWAPTPQQSGLWTICLHPNSMRPSEFGILENFLAAHAAECTSFERVLSEYACPPLNWREQAQEAADLYRVILRNKFAAMRRRGSGKRSVRAAHRRGMP